MTKLFAGVSPVVILAGLIAIAIGLADAWYYHHFGDTTDIMFVVGGLAAMGVHFLNGSAQSVVQAVSDLKTQVASSTPIVVATPTPAPLPVAPSVPSAVATPATPPTTVIDNNRGG